MSLITKYSFSGLRYSYPLGLGHLRVGCRRLLHEHAAASNFEAKYAEKLARVAQEKGTSVEDLRARLKEERERRRFLASTTLSHAEAPSSSLSNPEHSSTGTSPASQPLASPSLNVRKDSSPVKVSPDHPPFSTILNLPRLLETPHTASQVSALWTAYHLSRSNGTGRGYICAPIPVETYHRMMAVSKKYSSFVVPVPREVQGTGMSGSDRAYEFYFMQWGFHETPRVPSYESETDPFFKPSSSSAEGGNPQISTVLFTPLQEYKLRQAFATPYLVLTHYTDLAKTHGVVLLRGEITPSAAAPTPPSSSSTSPEEKYLLSQADAQVLAMGLQKFYLWNSGEGAVKEGKGEQLLKTFHETPEEFKWEELLKHADLTV